MIVFGLRRAKKKGAPHKTLPDYSASEGNPGRNSTGKGGVLEEVPLFSKVRALAGRKYSRSGGLTRGKEKAGRNKTQAQRRKAGRGGHEKAMPLREKTKEASKQRRDDEKRKDIVVEMGERGAAGGGQGPASQGKREQCRKWALTRTSWKTPRRHHGTQDCRDAGQGPKLEGQDTPR